jgi:metallo-beta-lactamase family protein
MKLRFFGANREVTGSRHIIEANGKKILIDCGLYQGRRADEKLKNKNFGFDPAEIDVVVISHAHIDHSGNLPNLVKQGFKGRIYCTHATSDLLRYMLLDSAHIQEQEVVYLNEKKMAAGEELIEPLYTAADVEKTIPLFHGVAYEECLPLTEGVSVCFHEAGHILGSAITVFTIKDQKDGKTKTFTFTGDLGRKNMPIIRNPWQCDTSDYLMIESTYGNRVHESLLDAETHLAEVVNKTIARGGKILIPAFSLGRTQEIVYSLHKLSDDGRIPNNLPIYVDSPLSVNLTSIFRQHLGLFDEETQKLFVSTHEDPFGFDSLKYVQTVDESKALANVKTPCIIIASSGMCEHGRILHHLKNNVEDHRNTLLIVGYQAINTLGRKLVEKEKEVRILGKPYQVKLEVKIMNAYSAHADRSDLLDYVTKVKDLKKVILVHGEDQAAEDLKKALVDNGVTDVTIPSFGDELEL